jgi:hypothetical protein
VRKVLSPQAHGAMSLLLADMKEFGIMSFGFLKTMRRHADDFAGMIGPSNS